jgi:hypothetical protein
MFGTGRKVINIEKFLIAERGTYTVDILEKTPTGLKFLTTKTLFTAEYPPKRKFRDGEVEAILNSKEKIIKTIKTEFKAPDMKEPVKIQLSLDVNDPVEEGHILFPNDDILELDGKKYDLTGLRREMEWMFGRPIPKNQPQDMIKTNNEEETSKEEK